MKTLGAILVILGTSLFFYTFMVCLSPLTWNCANSISFNVGGVVSFLGIDLAVIGGLLLFKYLI